MAKFNILDTLISIKYQIMFRNAKSLVRHLLTADLSKRYGNLKDGIIYFG